MHAPSSRRHRVAAITAIALTLAITAPGLVAPASAAAAVNPPKHRVARGFSGTRAAAKKPTKPKQAKASTHVPWAKRDLAEMALLAVAPFVAIGLLLFFEGSRRLRRAAPGSEDVSPAAEAEPHPS